ncbi:MAG: DUF1203 domain-containing protein [Pseudomonadales bacterium]|nr:DUF1203 domain-containing protein [Pseudomonadales bacterium]NRA17439.1 DUF1203 domain-containing protein [Oceanospirillaceae bacterium]
MTFQIHALSSTPYTALFSLTDSELNQRNIVKTIVEEQNSYPCRVSLEDADIGETVILVNYSHLPEASPFQASHAIFVRQNATQATPEVDSIPQMITRRLISVRAFDAEHLMLTADVVEGEELKQMIGNMLEDNKVQYLHLHYARPGCFAAKVTRASV